MKTFIQKNIGFISIALGVLGLIGQYIILTTTGTVKVLWILYYVHLSDFNFLHFNVDVSGRTMNWYYLVTLFYLTLIIGGILYFRKIKEKRLLLFAFSVLLLSKVLGVVYKLTADIYSVVANNLTSLETWLNWMLGLGISVFLCYLSYHIIVHLSASYSLAHKDLHVNDRVIEELVPAGKLKRFFHLFFDLFICLLIIHVFAFVFSRSGIVKGLVQMGSFGTLIILIAYRLIYYPFFETLFGATPAKFLTGTRVVDVNGEKPDFKKSLMRTLYRFVPFEPFSFFGKKGWHDEWSETQVVEVQEPGWKGVNYLVLFPFFLIFLIGGYQLKENLGDWYTQNKSKQFETNRLETFKTHLDQLNQNDLIILVPPGGNGYGSVKNYLKFKSRNGDRLTFLLVTSEYSHVANTRELLSAVMGTNSQQYLEFSKSDLISALSKTRDAEPEKRLSIPGVNYNFSIRGIHRMREPVFSSGGGSVGGNNLRLTIRAKGYSCTLVSIENIKGGIKWITPLPKRMNFSSQYESNISIKGEGYSWGTDYEVLLTFKTDNGKTLKYRLLGYNALNSMYRVLDE